MKFINEIRTGKRHINPFIYDSILAICGIALMVVLELKVLGIDL